MKKNIRVLNFSKKEKEMQRKTLINLKGMKERVLPQEILAKLQSGYKVPNKVAYLYNSAGNLKKIILENNPEGQKKVIELLRQGFSFDENIVKKVSTPAYMPMTKLGDLFHRWDYNKEISKPLTTKIEELEKKLKDKEEEFEVFKKLSQINVEKAKKLQEENTTLKNKVFNAVTMQLLDIISTNELEEIVLNHKDGKYTFSVIVKK